MLSAVLSSAFYVSDHNIESYYKPITQIGPEILLRLKQIWSLSSGSAFFHENFFLYKCT